jgi:hypothetical protein
VKQFSIGVKQPLFTKIKQRHFLQFGPLSYPEPDESGPSHVFSDPF